jgi:hypothetical protein
MTQSHDQTNQEWQQLQEDWQSYQPDIAKIKKRIAWVTWRMIAILALDVVLLLGYIPFIVYWVFPEEPSFAIRLWHYAMAPLIVYGVYWDFKLRLPLFKLENESTKGILGFYLKRVDAGTKLGDLGYKFCLFVLVLFIVWVGASFYFELGEEKLQKASFIIFGVAWISLFGAIMYWYRNKKRKELVRLQALWKEFLD